MKRQVNSTYTKMDKSIPECYVGCDRCKGCHYNIFKIEHGICAWGCVIKWYEVYPANI